METYQQIHDFTPVGAARFAAFVAATARSDVRIDACRMECLGVMEDNLNGGWPMPLSWELGVMSSIAGKPVMFMAELADLIIEHVIPDE